MISRDFANGLKNGRNLESTAIEESESLDLDQSKTSYNIVRKKRNHRMI